MKFKYVVHPGMITSKNDGQRHYIGPMKLIELYGVDQRECEIYEPASWWPESYFKAAQEAHKGLIHLYPRNDGNYQTPKKR